MCKNKKTCFINQDLVGFEPTGKCPIDVLVKTQLGLTFLTQVNRMSKSRRVLATGGKQRSFGLHMVCFEMVLYHNEPH